MNYSSEINRVGPVELYNVLQDGFHLSVLDFRSPASFRKGFIRGSFLADRNGQRSESADLLRKSLLPELLSGPAKQHLYKTLHRLALIVEESEASEEEAIAYLTSTKLAVIFERKLILKNSFLEFQQRYPFLILSCPNSDALTSTSAVRDWIERFNSAALGEASQIFPFEFPQLNVCLGRSASRQNPRLLDDLNIEAVIEVRSSELEHDRIISNHSSPRFIQLSVNPAKMVDFDALIDHIETEFGSSKLLFCGLTYDLPVAFIVALFMRRYGIDFLTACRRTFTTLGSPSISPPLYNQLQFYVPRPAESSQIQNSVLI